MWGHDAVFIDAAQHAVITDGTMVAWWEYFSRRHAQHVLPLRACLMIREAGARLQLAMPCERGSVGAR